MKQKVFANGKEYSVSWLENTVEGQNTLRYFFNSKTRPFCSCFAHGVPMYVSRRRDSFHLARLPGSGWLHHPSCPSVSEENLFSGESTYCKGVINEQFNGSLQIRISIERLDKPPSPSPVMCIDGLLHLLFDHSSLNKFTPSELPRNWEYVRHRILLSFADCFSLNPASPLPDLFAPPPFSRETADEQKKLASEALAGKKLLFAPLKSISFQGNIAVLAFKHLPALRFLMRKDVSEALSSRWGADFFSETPQHSVCLALTKPSKSDPFCFFIQNMAMQPTDKGFFPCTLPDEIDVVTKLKEGATSFFYPLRYDSPHDALFADYALIYSDTPVPVFVMRNTVEPVNGDKKALISFMKTNKLPVEIFDLL